jgi:hypothetical protein
VPQREALDPAIRFVNDFDKFPSFLSAAIAHKPSIGEYMANMGDAENETLPLRVHVRVTQRE